MIPRKNVTLFVALVGLWIALLCPGPAAAFVSVKQGGRTGTFSATRQLEALREGSAPSTTSETSSDVNGVNGKDGAASKLSSSLETKAEDILTLDSVLQMPTMISRMATDVMRRVRWGDVVSPAQSASIYMNPATQKLASDLDVTWEPDVADMVKALQRLKAKSGSKTPLLVGVIGIPGSGKSTSCDILASYLDRALVMPMDGYHLSLEQLADMPDPADVIYRRGAPDTFDPESLKKDLEKIKFDIALDKVSIPGFDHAVGDPQPEQHTFVRADHDIVIVEGIYLLHNNDGWEHVKPLLDFCIYIEADVDVCIDRLKIRNQCIPGYTKEEIEIRCEAVDRVNAETVLRSSSLAGLTVQSSAMKSATKPVESAEADECEAVLVEEITTEEEIEQYVETVQEEAEAILENL